MMPLSSPQPNRRAHIASIGCVIVIFAGLLVLVGFVVFLRLSAIAPNLLSGQVNHMVEVACGLPVLTALPLLLAWFVFQLQQPQRLLRRRGIQTTGTVLTTFEQTRGSIVQAYADVSFWAADGTTYTATILIERRDAIKVAEIIPLRYDRKNPRDAAFVQKRSLTTTLIRSIGEGITWLFIIGEFCLGVGFFYLWLTQIFPFLPLSGR